MQIFLCAGINVKRRQIKSMAWFSHFDDPILRDICCFHGPDSFVNFLIRGSTFLFHPECCKLSISSDDNLSICINRAQCGTVLHSERPN